MEFNLPHRATTSSHHRPQIHRFYRGDNYSDAGGLQYGLNGSSFIGRGGRPRYRVTFGSFRYR